MLTVQELLTRRLEIISGVEGATKEITRASQLIADCFHRKSRLFIFGNGGSAADAQHMAAEFVGRFSRDRPGLPAIALTTDTSALTAIANDWDYSYVFKRQLEALAHQGDVVLGITTSGKSRNVLDALEHAYGKGITTICITCDKDTDATLYSDVIIATGGNATPIIQERMLIVEHIICELVDDILSTK